MQIWMDRLRNIISTKPRGVSATETMVIDSNNYWTAGKGQEHKFFVYLKVVDEYNTDNVFFKYVDSKLSIRSLKTRILMHSNRDLNSSINLRVTIDTPYLVDGASCNLHTSDAILPQSKHEKSLEDVLAKFKSTAFLLGTHPTSKVVIFWSTLRR